MKQNSKKLEDVKIYIRNLVDWSAKKVSLKNNIVDDWICSD